MDVAAEHLEAADVRAIVDLRRRQAVPAAVPREKRDGNAAESTRDVGVRRRAERRLHHLLARRLDRRQIVEPAAADQPDRPPRPVTPGRLRRDAGAPRSPPAPVGQGQRVARRFARRRGDAPARARTARSPRARAERLVLRDRQDDRHHLGAAGSVRETEGRRRFARACRSRRRATARRRGTFASSPARRGTPSGSRRIRPRTRCARWRCRAAA